MTSTKYFFILICLSSFFAKVELFASSSYFTSQLGKSVDVRKVFEDEQGRASDLNSLISKKPTLLAFVYYSCPNSCELLLRGLALSLSRIDRLMGDKYNVIVLSIDPLDKASLAAERKSEFLRSYQAGFKRQPRADGVHFLVGGGASLLGVTQSVGLKVIRDEKTGEYAHPGVLAFIAPDGRITNYLFGLNFSVADLDKGLDGAAQGKISALIKKFIVVCAHYLPLEAVQSQKMMGIIRYSSVLFLMIMGATLYLYSKKGRPV